MSSQPVTSRCGCDACWLGRTGRAEAICRGQAGLPADVRDAYLRRWSQSRDLDCVASDAIEHAAEARAVRDFAQCQYRSEPVGLTACQSCSGLVNLPLYECRHPDSTTPRCTVDRRAADDSVAWCPLCRLDRSTR